MGRAEPKSSPTDDYAKRIAGTVAAGREPSFIAEVELYCESSPGEVFAAFTGVARHMPPAGRNEALAAGYLFLLQRLLEHLRYRTDRGYSDAAELIADFQAGVADAVKSGRVDPSMLIFVGGALHQSRIPVSPEFAAATTAHTLEQLQDAPLPAEIEASTAAILNECDDDPFVTVAVLAERAHGMPRELRAFLAGEFAKADTTKARGAAVLFLLDPDAQVRRGAAASLAAVAAGLTPVDLRRLIAIRNWRPENERSDIDSIVRKARGAGIDCAQWPASSAETTRATCIDGSSTQSFLLVSPAGRKKRLSSILVKDGIVDAWTTEPEARRWIETTLSDAMAETPCLPVSRSYLDRVVADQLAVTVAKESVPPFGLLKVAEFLGGADWQPARIDFAEALAALLAEIPVAMRAPRAFASVLRRSDELLDLLAIATSWFEDDPEVARVVKQLGPRNRAKGATYLLQTVISRRRERWAEIVLRTALWMREAPLEENLCWRELGLVAEAIAGGRDLSDIGLMRDVAMRTIAGFDDSVWR